MILAIQLLTRLPIKKQVDAVGADYAGSVAWFWLTSLLVGGVMLGVFALTQFLFHIAALSAFLSVIAACLFTGGFHVDGFADMCDAFFARKPKERTLEILKDSRMGTYGVIAICFVLAVKTILLAQTGSWQLLLALPVCGKIPMITCAMVSRYPRQDGLGKYIIELLSRKTAVLSIVLCAAIVFALSAWPYDGATLLIRAAVCIGAGIVLGLALASISKRKIGGATGDILGAANEMGEMLFLAVWAAL